MKAVKSLTHLVEDGIIKLALLPEDYIPQTFHVVYATKPKQLWVEQFHKEHPAYGVYYTDDPISEVWDNLLSLFNDIWKDAEEVKREGISLIDKRRYT